MNKFLTVILFVATLCALSFAQLRQLNNSSNGEGRIIIGGHTNEKVTKAQVDLRSNGDFEIKLSNTNMWRVSGTWRLNGQNRCELRVRSAIGDNNATGTGTIWLENMNTVKEITINGLVMGDNLIATFSARGNSGGDGGSHNIDLNQTKTGNGTLLTTSNRTVDISRVTVSLRRDGSVTITAIGDKTYVFSGSQTSASDRMVDISIDRADSSFNADGKGFIALENSRSFSRVELAGRDGSRRFNLQFSAGSGGGGGNWIDSLNDRAHGDGSFRNGRSRDTFGQVDLNCRRDGRFDMRIYSDRTESITGTWRATSRTQITLDVERAFNTNATARGTVKLSSAGNVDEINVSGNNGSGSFSLDFSAGDSNSSFDGCNVSAQGRGWLKLSGERDQRIDEMKVWLKPNGTAELTLEGDMRRTVFTGLWSDFDSRRNTVQLEVIRGFGATLTTASGTVTLNRQNSAPERVEFGGRYSGDRFSVTFDLD